MSNTGINLKKVICKDEKFCTTSRYYCNTCLRNKANTYSDKFSMKKEGYNPIENWSK